VSVDYRARTSHGPHEGRGAFREGRACEATSTTGSSARSHRPFGSTDTGRPKCFSTARCRCSRSHPARFAFERSSGGESHDLKIRAGNWPVRKAKPFPTSRAWKSLAWWSKVGAAVSRWVAGQRVITMMQASAAFARSGPGGYSEFVTVDAGTLPLVPEGVELDHGGVRAGRGHRLPPAWSDREPAGRRILVTGAAGGVGSAACAIAHALRCGRRRGIPDGAGRDVRNLGAEEVIVSPKDRPAAGLAQSFDGVLDTVALSEAVEALGAWLVSGSIHAPPRQVFLMAQVAAAHRLLEAGGVSGRVLLALDRLCAAMARAQTRARDSAP